MHAYFLPPHGPHVIATSHQNPFAQNKTNRHVSTPNLPLPKKMMLLLRVGLALILPRIAVVFALYLCVLWHAVQRQRLQNLAKLPPNAGMTTLEIQCIPVMAIEGTRGEWVCRICLEEIGAGEPARVLRPCSYAFHVPCADAYFARNAVCPLWRAKLTVDNVQRKPQQNC